MLEVKCLSPNAVLPTRAHADDAGLDLYSLELVTLKARSGVVARTGVAVAIHQGHVGLVADRSSLAKKGVKTAGGVIDAGYRGEVLIVLWNLSDQDICIEKGERLAQLLILPVATPAVRETDTLSQTHRDIGGFGSTGK